MALTETEINTQIDRLKTAMSTGARRVKIGDRETEFNSYNQMRLALEDLQSQLDGLVVTKRRNRNPRNHYAKTNPGLR